MTVDLEQLPSEYPTHAHSGAFWEALGRLIGTFGYLEFVLGRAIFALTATKEYSEEEMPEAMKKWIPTLQRMLSDTLNPLIDAYENALKKHDKIDFGNYDHLADDLRSAAGHRNVVCHGMWNAPDDRGYARPIFVNRRGEIASTRYRREDLDTLRRSVLQLSAAVINSVQATGWQFPGTLGPGRSIIEPR